MFDLLFRNRRLLLIALILIVSTGAIAYNQLPRQEDPTITPRFGLVLTFLPGSTAERVEALVTEKIERELREIEEIKEIASTSRSGVSAINVELRDTVLAAQVDTVWSRVRDRLSDVQAELPRGASAPELQDREQTDAYTLIAGLRWTGTTEPNRAVLRRLGEDIRDLLRDVPGTSFVEVFGAAREEIRVDVDREQAARLGLSAAGLARQLGSADAKVPAGLLRGAGGSFTIEVSGELDGLERIRDLPVGHGPDGQVVRLRDTARITKAVADPARELAVLDGDAGVAIAARMATQERTDLWAAAVRAELETYGADLPAGVTLEVIFDQSRYVEARLGGLKDNLLLGVLLVVGVILLMMGWRSAVVVAAALPLSTLMVLAGLKWFEVPIQQMSITGLIIALGLLIDNAIIMVDEVSHRLREGKGRAEAIRESARFLAVPLLASTITTVLAFMPMILVPGPMGEFVGTMAISVVLALVSSFLLALTVVPTLVGLLGGIGERGPRWWREGLTIRPIARLYRGSLGFMLRHPGLALLFAVALPVVGFVMVGTLDEQFFPSADRDQIRVELRLPEQASIEDTHAAALRAREILMEHEGVAHVHWFVGRDAPKFYYNMLGGKEGSPHFAEALVELDTHEGVLDRVNELQAHLDRTLPEAQVLVRPLEQGPPFDAPIELRIYGPDLDVLRDLGGRARAILAEVPEVTHTRASFTQGRPKVRVDLDEPSLRRTGLRNTDVAAQLDAALEGAIGGSVLEGTEELPVRVRLVADERGRTDRLASLDLLSARPGARATLPLGAVGDVTLAPEAGAITRQDGRRANTVQGFVEAGILPTVALAHFRESLEASDFRMPAGYRMEFAGEEAERNRAVSYLIGNAVVLMIIMVAALVMALGSFRLMGLILTIGGLSIGLGFLSLWVFGHNFGFMAIVGSLGLMGVAINDAIAVLAGIRADPGARAGDPVAMERVVAGSTRHVMSTTITTAAGFLPLILAGGAFWPPLAVAIAGGVMGSSILALYFLPAAYRLIAPKTPAAHA